RADIQAAISEQQIKKYPDDFTANFRMGDLMLMRNLPADAVPYFQKAAESDPHSVLAATELGNAYFAAKQIPESIAALRHALEIDPTYTDARYNLASVLATSGSFEDAAHEYEQVLKDQPDNLPARQHRAEVLVLWADQIARAGDDNKAIAMYREAMPELISNPAVHVRLGMAYARQERLEEAQTEFETVQRLDPQSQIAAQAIAAIVARRKSTGK
ncbi:MAG: tetratricopeptide repeat protein, partial [Acidobacteriota bacterium]|nr:tetratricopeptide repeat protein [Acidobacteriota bacterium]